MTNGYDPFGKNLLYQKRHPKQYFSAGELYQDTWGRGYFFDPQGS